MNWNGWRIDPSSRRVIGWLDLTELVPAGKRGHEEHVLNGIAYDEETGRIFVTGKCWPVLYEIRVAEGE
jgi:glutaminyl-peptide cyclotransferase